MTYKYSSTDLIVGSFCFLYILSNEVSYMSQKLRNLILHLVFELVIEV